MANGKRKDELSREEDYREFEQRDLEDGWPYDDDSTSDTAPVDNSAYGEDGENSGRRRHEGYGITNADRNGNAPFSERPEPPETGDERGVEDDDQLESDIAAVIENETDVNLDAIDIHVEDGVVTLRGEVDTVTERRLVELKVLGVKGVRRVRNHINTIGTDSHIPRDTE